MDGPPPVVAMAELVQLLGVSKTRVVQLIARPDFPAPVAELSVGRIWRYSDVLDYCERTGRSVRPVKRAADREAHA
ncbi:hypothetical protein GCM10011594_32620 [Nakamurella endophytica]|uniref:Uncharacterized protein n=1 Tax=Nakamurella endophytica TaxID=1748367 RepID=A0A917T5W1_9ACTN|nr:hypothetical protein GCM10011594_32620 [Nakamurella endophytica]